MLHRWVREQEGNPPKIAGSKNEAVSSEEFEHVRREAKVRTELLFRLLRRDWNYPDCLSRASSTSARDAGLLLLDFIIASD